MPAPPHSLSRSNARTETHPRLTSRLCAWTAQAANAPVVLGARAPAELVGSQLDVYWETEKEWFVATVVRYISTNEHPFKLSYMDGDRVRSLRVLSAANTF